MLKDEELNPRELRFVQAYCKNGGRNAGAAAIVAGYSKNGAPVTAHRLLKRQKVLIAIRAEAERCLRAGVALGASMLMELAEKANSESVRFQAAQALLDRGGLQLKALSEHRHIIEDKRTDGELLARIEQLTRELGISTKVIQGEAATVSTSPPLMLAPIPAEHLPAILPEDGEEAEMIEFSECAVTDSGYMQAKER
ncbi:MAG: terminase small subunit [Zoogloeaceae bacterium]|nr:terminase small subunit [Zoogloeaceae bacterium]